MAKILVIDDDKIMNDMLVQMLQKADYEAEGAMGGAEGLKLFKEEEFDLIVTDIVMPETEGLETIMAVRKTSKTLPIIAISGGGRVGPKDYLHMAQRVGADYTFPKPIEKDELLAAIRECLA